MTRLLQLGRDDLHLWLTCPDTIGDAPLLARYRELLTDEERARVARFVFPRHRHQGLVARAFVRAVLSRYRDVPPQAWSFCHNEHGRPEISGPALPGSRLRFNLSHTDGLMCLGVTRERDVGVDVEHVLRRVSALEIADRFFAARELSDLRALPAATQRQRFFHYWTLKEAYIKGRGMGLALPLGKFAYTVRGGQPLDLWVDAELDDEADSWRLCLLAPSHRHTAAVAARQQGDAPLALTTRTCVPLRHEQTCQLAPLASRLRPLPGGR